MFIFGTVVIGCRLVFAKTADRVPAARLSGFALGVDAVGLTVLAGWPSASWSFTQVICRVKRIYLRVHFWRRSATACSAL